MKIAVRIIIALIFGLANAAAADDYLSACGKVVKLEYTVDSGTTAPVIGIKDKHGKEIDISTVSNSYETDPSLIIAQTGFLSGAEVCTDYSATNRGENILSKIVVKAKRL